MAESIERELPHCAFPGADPAHPDERLPLPLVITARFDALVRWGTLGMRRRHLTPPASAS